MLLSWVGDRLVPATDAVVSVFDRGFRSGEGIFETMRSYRGHVFRLPAHLDRARAGAEVVGFDLPPVDVLHTAVRQTAQQNLAAVQGGDAALRLTVTPGVIDPLAPFPGQPQGHPTLVVTAQPLAIPAAVYREGVSAYPVPCARELPHIKALSYLAASLASREARQHGADEALLVDREGMVLEGSASNVFAVLDGTVVTPPVAAGLLAGVTRAVAIDVAARLGISLEERRLTLDELLSADEAMLTASTREVIPLVRVAGTRIGDGRPGPVTRRLHAGYRDEVDREIASGADCGPDRAHEVADP